MIYGVSFISNWITQEFGIATGILTWLFSTALLFLVLFYVPAVRKRAVPPK